MAVRVRRGAGYEAMDETRVNWWMDAGSHWHRGRPPSGFWQAEDGRWHPPGDDEPTVEMREGPPPEAAHLAGGPRSSVVDGWGWPRWARIAVLASVAVVAVVVVVAGAIAGRGGDDDLAVTAESTTTVAPGTSAASSAPTAEPSGPGSSIPGAAGSDGTDTSASPTTERGPTTSAPPTSAAPTTTRPPPADPGVRQGVPCSPEGATAVSDGGVPMTCTTQKCHGAPYDSARWRRAAC
jgi:hypothetical protein